MIDDVFELPASVLDTEGRKARIDDGRLKPSKQERRKLRTVAATSAPVSTSSVQEPQPQP